MKSGESKINSRLQILSGINPVNSLECKELSFIKSLLEEPYWNEISFGYDGHYHISPYNNFEK